MQQRAAVGSTGVAALELERKFIGYELDETYFQAAQQRIEDYSNTLFHLVPPSLVKLPMPKARQNGAVDETHLLETARFDIE